MAGRVRAAKSMPHRSVDESTTCQCPTVGSNRSVATLRAPPLTFRCEKSTTVVGRGDARDRSGWQGVLERAGDRFTMSSSSE